MKFTMWQPPSAALEMALVHAPGPSASRMMFTVTPRRAAFSSASVNWSATRPSS
jgi:hypothetical protein